MHYDFAITTHEAPGPGRGEIGAYTHRVLHTLASAGLRCVAFVGEQPDADIVSDLPPGMVDIVLIRTDADPLAGNMGGAVLNFTRDLCLQICEFLRGHSIHAIEFPDLRAEGYFFIQHNLVHRLIPTVAVRLHGPTFLLDETNVRRLCIEMDALIYAAELESIQSADHLIHAGGTLLDRVLGSFSPDVARDIRERSVCIPRPGPVEAPRQPPAPARATGAWRDLVVPTAFEYRVGLDRFVFNAVRHLTDQPDSPWRFVCLGEDSNTTDGGSFLGYLRTLIPDPLRARFVFATGLSPNQRSKQLDHADAFLLPHRSASHLDAFWEIIPRCKPVAVSSQLVLDTAMRAHPGVLRFDAESRSEWNGLFDRLARLQPVFNPTSLVAVDDGIARRYRELPTITPGPTTLVNLAIVIAHYEDVDNLSSLLIRLHNSPDGDRLEIIVVDDGSSPAAQARLQTLRELHAGVRWLSTDRPRSGPFAARLLGTRSATAGQVAFVDSDDYIETTLYLRYAESLARTPALDVVLPSMRCFGRETYHWIPLPKARFTVFFTGFAHTGLIGRRDLLLRAFTHAQSAVDDIAHGEDCIFSLSLLFTGARIAGILETAYHYNRTTATSRSQINGERIWHSRHLREQYFDRCMAETLAQGRLTPLDLRTLRQLALNLPPEHSAINLHRRKNRVPWHTHLYRAIRSMLGDPRYSV